MIGCCQLSLVHQWIEVCCKIMPMLRTSAEFAGHLAGVNITDSTYKCPNKAAGETSMSICSAAVALLGHLKAKSVHSWQLANDATPVLSMGIPLQQSILLQVSRSNIVFQHMA